MSTGSKNLWVSYCGKYKVTDDCGVLSIWKMFESPRLGRCFRTLEIDGLCDKIIYTVFTDRDWCDNLAGIIEDAWNGVSMGKDNETNEALFSSIKDEVYEEIRQAIEEYPSMNSYAEGLEILREEFDEVTEEIRKKRPDRSRVMGEMTQVAAMAIRFMHDLDNADERGYRKDKNKGG